MRAGAWKALNEITVRPLQFFFFSLLWVCRRCQRGCILLSNVTQVLRVLVYNSTSLSCTYWTDNIVRCVCVCVLSIKSFRSFYLWKCKFCWLKKQVNYNIIISNYVVKYTIDDQKKKGINEQWESAEMRVGWRRELEKLLEARYAWKASIHPFISVGTWAPSSEAMTFHLLALFAVTSHVSDHSREGVQTKAGFWDRPDSGVWPPGGATGRQVGRSSVSGRDGHHHRGSHLARMQGLEDLRLSYFLWPHLEAWNADWGPLHLFL